MNKFRKWLIEALGGYYGYPIGLEPVQFKVDHQKVETLRSAMFVDTTYRPIPPSAAEEMVKCRLLNEVLGDYVSITAESVRDGVLLYAAEIKVVTPEKQRIEGGDFDA